MQIQHPHAGAATQIQHLCGRAPPQLPWNLSAKEHVIVFLLAGVIVFQASLALCWSCHLPSFGQVVL